MEWRPISEAPRDGTEWRVSDFGVVTCNRREKRQWLSDKGYRKVTVGGKTVSVHRLVAAAFVPNPDGLPEVNHINGCKSDNLATNLEWCTRSQNMKHAYAAGLHPGVVLRGEDSPNWRRNGSRHPQSVAVLGIGPNGERVEYESQNLAENDGFNSAKISMCINGHRRTHKGFRWMPLPPPPDDFVSVERMEME